MIIRHWRFLAGFVFVAMCFVSHSVQGQSNGVLREVYLNIPGSTLPELTNNPSYPSSPSEETIQTIFEAPVDIYENYGQRMRALLIAPTNGQYTFWISSDDQGALFLSTTDNPAQRTQISYVNTWTSSRQWDKEANQQSAPITLIGGQRYYIEALQKEGGGGDNLAVGWQLPDGTLERPIPSNRLLVYGLAPPQISQHPTNTTVIENTPATFTVKLNRMIGATFQWQRNGTNIPGANSPTYTLLNTTLSDSTARFRCFATNSLGFTNSNEAILTVLPDATKPVISSVVNLGDNQLITVTFSEPVEESTATNSANYTLNHGASVLVAVLLDDLRSVVLTTTPLLYTTNYSLVVNNVRDRASTPNTILPNSQRGFSLSFTPLTIERVQNTAVEPLGPSSRRTGLVISEIMFHPITRADGRNLEYVELYNSQEWSEDISGFRLSGEIDYTFPSNTVLAAKGFMVVAASPADMQAAYGIANARGPFTNALSNGSGTVRLRNRLNAVLLEAEYGSDPPYPPAADGAGHSLVLARPSYGERDPRAWGASVRIGGSPNANETTVSDSLRTIVINEIVAHTDPPDKDYIELYNYSSASVNLGSCALTDDPDTNKFLIPTNTIIPARGFVVFTQDQLGFALSSGGEAIFLRTTNNTRVVDALRYEAQANGISYGRYPDGAPAFGELIARTPGSNNVRRLSRDVVINEIMYNPISRDGEDEYVELYNLSSNAVDLAGWRFTEGINYNFPSDSFIPGGGYLVVAKNVQRLLSNHPGLASASVLGNFSGSLANDGERLALAMPDQVIDTNEFGVLFTNTIRVVVDEVYYGTGGRWGQWTDGDGSSLELIDPRADHRLAANWADSDESQKSDWVTVEWTGVLDHGQGPADTLQLFLLGAGEAMVDNVEVIQQGGANLIANSTFASGFQNWSAQGNQDKTGLAPTGGIGNSACMHLRASGRGDTGANRVWSPLTSALNAGVTATLRARVRWLKGNPEILLRLHGSWLEAPGTIINARNLGTPGAINSRAKANVGPAILNVMHSPVLPAANGAIQVSARVSDPDGLAALQVRYRVDPSTNYNVVSMNYNGAGHYSASIPGTNSGAMIAFYVEAQDNFQPRASSRFPNDAPTRECLIRVGEATPAGTFASYRLWVSDRNINRWSAREKLSNDPLDATYVYGASRVVYNVGAQYGGSPYHSPSYNSPIGNVCDYVLTFPDDELFLGDSDINLLWPGNGGGDGTLQREQTAYWTAYQLGLPFCHRRHVHVYVNGVKRGALMEDAQQPNRDMADQWYPDGLDGDLHKIQLWFEFDAAASAFNAVGASLGNFTTTGGEKKLARYRWNWASRAFRETANDYTNLFALMDVATTSTTGDAYTRTIQSTIDIDQWLRTFAVEKAVGNVDSYGYGGGQNMYTYRPRADRWKLLIWDIDFAYAYGSPTEPVFGWSDGEVAQMANHPPFYRMFLRALQDIADGPYTTARSGPLLDAKYNAFVAAGLAPENPAAIKSYIAARRDFFLQVLSSNSAPFRVSGTNQWTTNRNLITLTGTASFEIADLLVNGTAYQASWTTPTNWVLRLALEAGTNNLVIQGRNNKGQILAPTTTNIEVVYNGRVELPEEKIVINEIMYNPRIANSAFLELMNTSSSNAFDLSGFRLDGLDFVFDDGAVIEPGSFLTLARDAQVFNATYGASIPVSGEFPGNFDNGGETVRLVKPGATPVEDITIDEVTYDDEAPWPAAADGTGPSLQLIDARQDNARVANWAAVSAANTNPPLTLVTVNGSWKYNQSQDLSLINWTAPSYNDANWSNGVALLHVEEAALPAPKGTQLTLGRLTYYFRTRFNVNANVAGASLKLRTIIDDGAVFYLNGQEIFRLGMPGGTVGYSTLASRGVGDAANEGPFILPASALMQGENVLAVEVHQSGSTSSDIVMGLTLETTYEVANLYTPGAGNSVTATLAPFPTLTLNEIMPNNFFLGTNGVTDRFGDRDPWVELYNSGTNVLSLSGFSLGNNYSNLSQWAFPPNVSIGPKQFLLVWLDGEAGESITNELHASFRITNSIGSLVLARNGGIIDYLNYSVPNAGRSFGSYPDGRIPARTTFHIVTAGGTNNPASAPVNAFINEWMASNNGFLFDPADGSPPDYEDWFEIYNAEENEIDLSGYYLTDLLTDQTKWRIPNNTRIPAKGFLLVWADEETSQNGFNGDLHANFRLGASGEELGIFAPDGTLIDGVTFGNQTNNISQGRFRDGQSDIFFMTNPTPRTANYIFTSNSPPSIAAIEDRSIPEGSTFAFNCVASDSDPFQQLIFTLDIGAPAGASINASNGLFRWQPSEEQGPGLFEITVRVTDNGSPALDASRTFSIQVNEVNNAPVITPLSNRAVDEGTMLSVSNSATDADPGTSVFTWSLEGLVPAGMSIDSMTGTITWQPNETHGPGSYPVVIRVTDNGEPPQSDSKTLSIFVNEINSAPTISPIAEKAIHANSLYSFQVPAGDQDIPANALSFALEGNPPTGSGVDASGLFSWLPPESSVGGTNDIEVRVTDNGSPQLSAARTFRLIVHAPLPILTIERRENDSVLLTWNTIAGKTYQIQTNSTLPGSWVNSGPAVAAQTNTARITNEVTSGTQKFYRVQMTD